MGELVLGKLELVFGDGLDVVGDAVQQATDAGMSVSLDCGSHRELPQVGCCELLRT